MFGESKVNYDIATLQQKINAGRVREAKDYILEYFAPAPPGVFRWIPSTQTIKLCTDQEVKSKFIRKDVIPFVNPETGEQIKIDIHRWFFTKYPRVYEIKCQPNKARIFDENGEKYINTFPGYLFNDPKPFCEFNQEVKGHVKAIVWHICNVLCSGKPDQEYYMMHWLAELISGKKMNTAL